MNIYAVLPIITAFLLLGLSLFVYSQDPKSPIHRTFGLFCGSMVVWLLSFCGMYLSNNDTQALWWARNGFFGISFIPAFEYHFILTFLQLRQPKILAALYILALLGAALSRTPLIYEGIWQGFWGYYPSAGLLYPIFPVTFSIAFLGGMWLLFKALRSESNPLRRQQIKYLLLAFSFGIPGVIDYIVKYQINIYPFGYIDAFLFLSLTGYAIARFRLMDINLAITRTAVFMAVYAAILGLPLLAALSWQPRLESALGNRWWVWVLLAYALLTTAAHYANLFFQKRAENRLLAEQRRYQAVLRQASQGMTLIKELDRLLKLIVHLLTRKVRIKHATIYLWEESAHRYILKVSRQWEVDDPPSLPKENPLIEFLHWHRSPLVEEELHLKVRGGAKELQPVLSSLRTLDAAVLIPSFVEDQCVGLFVLGEKISGSLYTQDDLQVFQVLASQAALAIENAQFYEELKRTQADLFQTAKMASLGHMAGGMSHQINNRFHVLTILAGTMKSVLKDQDPTKLDPGQLKQFWDKALETLAKVEENSLRGGDIVKTLLRFSRPSGEYNSVPIPRILDTALEVVQFRVNMSLFDLERKIPKDLPEVRGDLNQLADCCFNLISNAFDAMQKKADLIEEKQLVPAPSDPDPYRGKMQIKAYAEKQRTGGSAITLELKDNGVGMNKQDLENLFVPFFTTKATAQKGTGLGLYIIQRILEQHGGSIHTSSEYGVGTTFKLQIPIYQEIKKPQDLTEEPKKQQQPTPNDQTLNKGKESAAA